MPPELKCADTVRLDSAAARAAAPAPAASAAAGERRAAWNLAAASPLPGPAAEAFAPAPLREILGFPLLPLTAGHIAILHGVESPFLSAIRIAFARAMAKDDDAQLAELARQAAEIYVSVEDLAVALFIFSRPAPESRSWFLNGAKHGVTRAELIARFRENAAAHILDQLPPYPNLDAISGPLGEHYQSSFATALKLSPVEKEGAGTTANFPPPPTAQTATASAGSSTSSSS